MKRIFICFLFLLIAYGCSSEPELTVPDEIASLENLDVFPVDTEPEYELSLSPETTFGDTDDVFLSDWLLAAVDDRDRVYIADNRDVTLHLYNPDGTYNQKIGTEGEGPGEYRSIGPLLTDSRYLHLMDRNQRRITRFDLDTFEQIETFSVSMEQAEGSNLFPSSFFLQTDSTYIIEATRSFRADGEEDMERHIDGFTMNQITEETGNKSIYSFPASEMLVYRNSNMMMMMTVYFNRNSVTNMKHGELVYGWADDFLFKFYDKDGNYQRAFYYPYENLPLNRNDMIDMYADREEQWQDIVRDADMPPTLPMFSTFTLDDEGRIWVERLTEDHEEIELMLLENSGELLGSISWSADHNIQDIRNGFLYAIVPDEDTGLQEVVKYRIELM